MMVSTFNSSIPIFQTVKQLSNILACVAGLLLLAAQLVIELLVRAGRGKGPAARGTLMILPSWTIGNALPKSWDPFRYRDPLIFNHNLCSMISEGKKNNPREKSSSKNRKKWKLTRVRNGVVESPAFPNGPNPLEPVGMGAIQLDPSCQGTDMWLPFAPART